MRTNLRPTVAPSISIVTASLNQGTFIERTIRSVLDQGIDDLEYVVMDGGSTDQTMSILRRYQTHLRWTSQADSGQSQALNRGFMATSGPIIGWLNSDDVYCPGALRSVLKVFAENPNVDVVYGMGDYVDEQDRVLGPYGNEPWNFERLKAWCYFSQPSTFIRRRMLESHGPLNERLQYCMDYEYWLRLGKAGAKFFYLPQLLSHARLHEGAKTVGQRLPMSLEIVRMLKQRFGIVDEFWLMNRARALCEGRFPPSWRWPYELTMGALFVWLSLRWNRRFPLRRCARYLLARLRLAQ